MNAGYVNFISVLFPNAKITIDRFHIVQLINRSLNRTRVTVMNQFHSSNGEGMKKIPSIKTILEKNPKERIGTVLYHLYLLCSLWPALRISDYR